MNNTDAEIMQSYTVMVNGGSGVLVNAMTLDYSYVLTAAHVIRKKKGDIAVLDLDDINVLDYKSEKLKVLAVLIDPAPHDAEDPTYDCAILKVEYQARVLQRCFAASRLPHLAAIILVGYPATERGSADQIKQYDGHKTSVVNKLVILTINGVPAKSTIQGMSGGGVYHIQAGSPFLIGVEFQMDGTGEEQQYGRVQCHSLARFEEIITACTSAQMIPAHLECFSRMREMIFAFNVIDPNNVHQLKVALEGFADSLIRGGIPAPYEVMEQYDLQLLVDSKRPDELKNQELWVAYLEFLVICALMDNVGAADANYIKNIERKRRLLYTSDGSNWLRRLEELLKTARKYLDKNGTLIVASPEAAAQLLPPNFTLKNVISNIAVVPNEGPLAIDTVESAIYTSFKLTHLEGLRKNCVIDSEDEYQGLPSGRAQLQLFKDKLNEIIN
ncbi:ABC-three component system protein [Shewanella halifaxensis]|uniref:ABC-three component system protein n=1 Tax=Shewanella halifaxensis TaxID=271098 RepID=UPI001CBE828D|nr:ABC-three component system protein [Shewanella halifaxensis]